MVADRFPAPELAGRIEARCVLELGPCAVVANRSHPLGEALVLELADDSGRPWIAKAIRNRGHYQRELTAYREWVPALGDGAPALRLADDELCLLLLTRLAGEPAEGSERELAPEVFAQAGELTRRLHDSAPPHAAPDYAADLAERLERHAARAADLVDRADLELARALVLAAASLAPPDIVPCHLDNTPRNWLLDSSGRLRLFDFGQSRRDLWIKDVSRMYFRHWPGHPELREAFFAGYGRQPDEADWQWLRCAAGLAAVTTVVWAHEHDDPAFEQEGRDMLAVLRASG